MMRKYLVAAMGALTLLLAGCTQDGQLIDASGEAGGGSQQGGGGLAFIFMTVTIVVIVLLMFALDRIRRARLEAEEARQAEKANS
jgi:heme/copper-type cytochrome/quinol oxidase subunit 2